MRVWALVACLLTSTPVLAYTIDFEAVSGFTVGQAPPAIYSTPWGDVEFVGGLIVDDPLSPEEQMLGPVPGSEYFRVRLPPGIHAPAFLLVNPDENNQMVIAYFDNGWDDCGGSPCYNEGNDYGFTVGPASVGILVVDGEGAPFGSAGLEFYSGAHPDFNEVRSCGDTPEGCFYGWGVASISFVPEPSTAALVGVGLSALSVRRRVARGHLSAS